MKVAVKDSIEGDERTFVINVTAAASDFQMADLLRQRKVIDQLNRQLKHSVKEAIRSYLSTAEALVSALAKTPKRTPKRMLKCPTGESANDKVIPLSLRSLKVPRE